MDNIKFLGLSASQNVFDSQKSTEFFQYYGQTHTGLTSCVSKFYGDKQDFYSITFSCQPRQY